MNVAFPHLLHFVTDCTSTISSIVIYFSTMLDQSMNWKDAEKLCSQWGGHFALKGVMSVDDAKRAVDIGCTGIMVSNHGGRQLDGSRSPFDQLSEIVDAVGDKLDKVNFGGDVKPVLKSLSRFPPVIVSTVKAITSNFAALARSKQESFKPLSLWK